MALSLLSCFPLYDMVKLTVCRRGLYRNLYKRFMHAQCFEVRSTRQYRYFCCSVRKKEEGSYRNNGGVHLLIFLQLRTFATYYEILQVPKDASGQCIKQSYYKKCKELHPDKNKAGEMNIKEFLQVKKAYEVLKSTDIRMKYDSYLKSVDCSKYNFSEWQAYESQGTTNMRRDYQKYHSSHDGQSMGVDAKWSDFLTLYNLLCFTVISGIVTFIVWNEMKHNPSFKATSFLPRYYSHQTVYFDIKAKVPVPTQEENHTPVPVPSHVKKLQKAYGHQKISKSSEENNDVFQTIKTTGDVTEESLSQIKEKYRSIPQDQKMNSLTTWSTNVTNKANQHD